MRIVQIVPEYLYGDAVGNDVTAIHRILVESGFDTKVYARKIDERMPRGIALPLNELPALSDDDVALLHMATGDECIYQFCEGKHRRILIYHNITPPHFFKDTNLVAAYQCRMGINQVRYMHDKVDRCFAVSAWNKQNLEDMGYSCEIDIVPVVIPFSDYRETPPDVEVINEYRGKSGKNILFTGRVAPNKCFEDIIGAFYLYKKRYDPEARLFLVGAAGESDSYYRRLCRYVERLGVRDVTFTGHVGFAEILAYYSIADLFLCQSEHEGFCVPLIEAMLFGVPIVAYASTAIPDTLGASAILLDEKDPARTASVMNYVLTHTKLRQRIIDNQNIRLHDFEYDVIKDRFLSCIENLVGGQSKYSRKG